MKRLALIPLLLIGASVQAATIEIGTPSYIRPVGDQLYYFPADERAPPRVAWPGMENNARDINAPTTKGRVPITVNQKTPVSLNKLAGPALNLAKRAGPIGLGLTLAGLLCDQTDICSGSDPANPSGPAVFTIGDPSNAPYPYQHYEFKTNIAQVIGQRRFSTTNALCEAALAYYSSPVGASASGITDRLPLQGVATCDTFGNDVLIKVIGNDGKSYGQFVPGARVQSCNSSTHYLSGSQCLPIDPNKRLVVPPNGWPAPEDVPGLNDPGIIPDLIDGGEPLPVDAPEIEPKTVPSPSGSTTETVRNGAGEPIGTKTTDTTVTVTPSGPTTVNVTETTTITETNITNNTTTTTVQDTTLPNNEDQSEKPKEDTDLDIDDVPDSEVERYEVPDTFSYESWGGGSCPGDPSISAMGRSYNLPVHTVCEAITDMRPAVLLIAALVSAFIISGAFRQ